MIALHKVGELETVIYRWQWRECAECGLPAKYRLSYLLPNARINPASSGYRGDNISWCSDHEEFACKKHKSRMENDIEGYRWCATFPLKKYQHMGFYKEKP